MTPLKRKLKRYSIAGCIFVLITGSIAHFVYEWSGKSPLLGFFFPVSESTWEHMKLTFFPMLLYALYMRKKLKRECPGAGSALLFGTLLATFAVPVLFYTYSGIMGTHYAAADIAVFVISVIAAFAAVYKLSMSRRLIRCKPALKLAVCAVAVCFVVFTCFPPDITLFAPP